MRLPSFAAQAPSCLSLLFALIREGNFECREHTLFISVRSAPCTMPAHNSSRFPILWICWWLCQAPPLNTQKHTPPCMCQHMNTCAFWYREPQRPRAAIPSVGTIHDKWRHSASFSRLPWAQETFGSRYWIAFVLSGAYHFVAVLICVWPWCLWEFQSEKVFSSI